MTASTTICVDHLCRAQFGEDRILWKVFCGRTSGYFIEIGAFDGYTLSNTYFLEQMGWSGLLVEPIANLCQQAASRRPRSKIVHAACSKPGEPSTATFTVAQNVPVLSFLTADADHIERCKREGAELVEVEVPVTTVNAMLLTLRSQSQSGPWLQNHGWRIDVVSIDTEGSEIDVLEGFDLDRFKPRVLLIENDRPAGEVIEPYLDRRGYRKFHRQTINDFYIRRDDPAEDLRLEDLVPPNDV